MTVTRDCTAVGCTGTAVLDFALFSHVANPDIPEAAQAIFHPSVPLCYPHYCMAVNVEKRHYQVLDTIEKQAAMSKKIYSVKHSTIQKGR